MIGRNTSVEKQLRLAVVIATACLTPCAGGDLVIEGGDDALGAVEVEGLDDLVVERPCAELHVDRLVVRRQGELVGEGEELGFSHGSFQVILFAI